MKTTLYPNKDQNEIYLESETPEESVQLIKLVKRTKKPNRAHGNFRNGLAWAWINLPVKKNVDEYDSTSFSSE